MNTEGGVSDLAVISSDVTLGEAVSIGPFTVVGRDGLGPVSIGARTRLLDHVLIEPDVTIGDDCVIESHCRIGRGSVIPDGAHIRSGVRASGDTAVRHHADRAKAGPGEPDAAISPHAMTASNTNLGEGVEIGPFAIVGWEGEPPVTVGKGTKISPFALIEPGATVGAHCIIDAYCRVGSGSVIGDETQLLYGAAIFENARVGSRCIIGGDVADRTVIEDFVTYFGETAHDYRHPGTFEDWDRVETSSPRICERSVVGQYSVLVGGISIGPGSVISACETVHVDVPAEHFYQNRRMRPLSELKGFVQARTDKRSDDDR